MGTTSEERTPRAPLNRERVLAAALRLADAEGIDALTMRRLGNELGVQAMSLYNHVANKDDILDGIVDVVAGEIEVPSQEDPWKVAMRRRATSAHEVLLSHPWACILFMSRVNVGPAMLKYADATIGCLRGAGFSVPMADHAWNALDSFTYGFTLHKLNFPFDPSEYSEVAASYLPSVPADRLPHLREMTQHVAESRHDGIQDFGFGLGLLLDGLERALPTC